MWGKGSGKTESFIAGTISAIFNYLQRRMFNIDTL